MSFRITNKQEGKWIQVKQYFRIVRLRFSFLSLIPIASLISLAPWIDLIHTPAVPAASLCPAWGSRSLADLRLFKLHKPTNEHAPFVTAQMLDTAH